MKNFFQLVCTTLLLAAAARAQVSSPDKLIGPVPKTHTQRATPRPADDLQWMWQYAKPNPLGRAGDLRLDARFQSLLEHDLRQPQAMWGDAQKTRQPLAAIVPLFVEQYGAVTTEQNRYLSVDGCVPSFCPAHGLLWVDLGTPHPLVVFAAVNWSADGRGVDDPAANYELWLFPNRALAPDALPLALTRSLAHWDARLAAAHRGVPHIAHALIVEPDGSPYSVDPQMIGANTLAPQLDTTTPRPMDAN